MKDFISYLENSCLPQNERIFVVRGQRSAGKVHAFSVELNKIANERTILFAKEILEEIKGALNSNYKSINERMQREKVNPFDDPFCERCKGKIDALRGIEDFIKDNISKFVYNDPKEETE